MPEAYILYDPAQQKWLSGKTSFNGPTTYFWTPARVYAKRWKTLRGVQRMQKEVPIPTVIQTSDGNTINDKEECP